ncbi:MAG TPA: YciC family protein [Candidatus Saccharimonadales bacterium]|nr:YciC family protein [Candidatus Saccharimonadales bacterium]
MAEKKSKEVKTGSAFDLLSKSYETVKDYWKVFAFVNIFGIIYALMEALNPKDYDTNKYNNHFFTLPSDLSGFQLSLIIASGLLILLLFLAVNFFFFTMATSLEVKAAKNKRPDYSELINDGKKFFFPLLGLIIIMSVIISIGLLLLVVPGIIAIGRLAMAPYIMVEKRVGVEEALKRSNQLGKKYFGKVWAALLVMIVVTALFAGLLEIIPLLGPLAAVVVSITFSLVLALRYQQLQGHKV